MKFKKISVSLLMVLLIFSSISLPTAKAADVQIADEITIEASENNPLVLLTNPSHESETAIVITEDSTLTISEVGRKYREVMYTDDLSGEQISGYVLAEELEAYVSETTATKVVVAPSSQEPLELFIDGKLSDETTVYLTEETTLIALEAEGHYTTVKYTPPGSGKTVEALVLSDALSAAVIEDKSAEENTEYVVIPEGETLSFYDEPSAEGNLIFDLLADSYLTVGDEAQYVKLVAKNPETGEGVEGYILISDLIHFTNDIEERKEAKMTPRSSMGVIPSPVILDISHWQLPSAIDYDTLAKEVNLVIIRVQHGIATEDNHYKTHIQEFQKRNIPVHVYAFLRATTEQEAKEEASVFYSRAKGFDPIMYWVDVELDTAVSTTNMQSITSAYVSQLRDLVGDAKVGAYIAHNLYDAFQINTSELDGIWIPRYGLNDGYYNSQYNPNYTADIHQYTDQGKLNGYTGGLNGSAATLDLNRLTVVNGKGLTYFTSKNSNNTNNNGDNGSNNNNVNLSDLYYTENPGQVRLTSKLNVYHAPELNDSTKTGTALPVGTIVTVNGIAYTKAGTPRFMIKGGYISANKKFATTDTTTYYSSNPGTVILSQKVNVHSSPELNESTKTGQTYAKDTTLKVTGISYTKAGTPRLMVSGGHISANKKFSQQYYTSNPGTVYLTSTLNVYNSTSFNDSARTGKTYKKGTTVQVTGISYTKSGVARLHVNGGYISGNVAFSQKYISTNPGTVKLASNLNIYSSTTLSANNKTGKSLKKGTTVTVTGIAYSSSGLPRLKVNGGYISANAQFFQ